MNDDRQYLEFERQDSDRRVNARPFEGAVVAVCLTVIACTIIWVAFF